MRTSTVGARPRASEVVVRRVAEREGVDPIELEEPLFEAVDPDALDNLLGVVGTGDEAGPWVAVSFAYLGYEIRIDSEGRITVE